MTNKFFENIVPTNGTDEPEFKGYFDYWICNVLSWSGDVLLFGNNDDNSKLYNYDRQNQKCSSWGCSRGENGFQTPYYKTLEPLVE